MLEWLFIIVMFFVLVTLVFGIGSLLMKFSLRFKKFMDRVAEGDV